MRALVLRLIAATILIILMGVAVLALRGAPAPKKQPYVGTWRLTWFGGDDVVVLDRGGAARFYGRGKPAQPWVGRWHRDGKCLMIEALPPGSADPDDLIVWTLTFTGAMHGTITETSPALGPDYVLEDTFRLKRGIK